MSMDVHFSSDTVEWSTPQHVFDALNDEFRFTLDPAATKENAKCPRFYTVEQDGLAQDWSGERVFCNPPYGRVIGQWVEKMSRGGRQYASDYFRLVPIHKEIIGDALEVFKDEVKKLWKKAEKLGRPEAKTLKQTLLDTEALRGKVTGAPAEDSEDDE